MIAHMNRCIQPAAIVVVARWLLVRAQRAEVPPAQSAVQATFGRFGEAMCIAVRRVVTTNC
jgi:hypothetical protein